MAEAEPTVYTFCSRDGKIRLNDPIFSHPSADLASRWRYADVRSTVDVWDPYANRWHSHPTVNTTFTIERFTRGSDTILMRLPSVRFTLGLGYELKKLDAWKRANLRPWGQGKSLVDYTKN